MVRTFMITLFLLATQLHWSFTLVLAYIVYMGETRGQEPVLLLRERERDCGQKPVLLIFNTTCFLQ
ncbi:hypothetical protein CFP56_009675 [Quercus suber]|uniref:Secreted protein n=1 Tax=Quercus suber TaxID=58331 RepID=A0AAW0L257_QUESU